MRLMVAAASRAYFKGPPPAFNIDTLRSTSSEPILYYEVAPEAYLVYKETYDLPLVYLGPPTVTLQPQAALTALGQQVNLTVIATDVQGSELTYQWVKNGVDLPNETADTLSISSVQATDVGNYQVKVTNDKGTTLSEAATLTLTASELYTQEQFDAALTSGFNLGVNAVQVNPTGYGLLSEETIIDARPGSTRIEVLEGKANITLTLEETDDLSDWSNSIKTDATIQVDAPPGARFYRFKMTD